jgi:hypothetical protein
VAPRRQRPFVVGVAIAIIVVFLVLVAVSLVASTTH